MGSVFWVFFFFVVLNRRDRRGTTLPFPHETLENGVFCIVLIILTVYPFPGLGPFFSTDSVKNAHGR